ncbi:CD209 antigen-like protein E [Engraulis encrasicolus]|uniref:CD209 antigen-like protein E n=1 Tax=Engraulis encrasicolus TaxID=184585 RepID=UPI002FD3E28A
MLEGDSTVRYYRVAVVSLGLLCVLLTAIIILGAIKGTAERKQLQDEKQLQQFINNNLTQEQDQLHATINNLTQEIDKLGKMNNILTKEKVKGTMLILFNSEVKWTWTEEVSFFCDHTLNNCTFNSFLIITGVMDTHFGSSRYYIPCDERNWADSQQHCVDLGGHLVIIDSQEEQEFIISQLNIKRAWIGLSDVETEKVWKWVDGTPLSESGFWMKGEPNDQGGGEDCVEIIYHDNPLKTWNDDVCSEAKRFICEI